MNIDMKALKGVIEEIEASKVRQKGEADFQREAIKRAVKHHQLDGKAIRIVLQRRAMGDEKRDEQDYYVHAYEMALGGKKLAADALASGATIREAAAIGGISTGAAGNLAKVVQKSEKMDKPEDGDDGITDAAGRFPGKQGDKNAPLNLRVPEADGRSDREDGACAGGGEGVQRRADRGTAGGAGQDVRDPGASVECDVGERGDHAAAGRDAAGLTPSLDLAHNEVQPSAPPSVGAVAAEPRVAISVLTPHVTTDDDLTIPAHLRGPSPANRRVV